MPTTYADLVGLIIGIINLIIPAIFAVIFLYFVWKMFDSWILNPGDPAKVAEGKRFAVSAVIILVIMVSAWGIVELLRMSIFGF